MRTIGKQVDNEIKPSHSDNSLETAKILQEIPAVQYKTHRSVQDITHQAGNEIIPKCVQEERHALQEKMGKGNPLSEAA